MSGKQISIYSKSQDVQAFLKVIRNILRDCNEDNIDEKLKLQIRR